MNKKGFTLLELLVVVLIIGILAGIALPQYKRAIYKSRYNSLMALTKAIYQAEGSYYLVHNAYTDDLTSLDIDLSGCELSSSKKMCTYDWGECRISLSTASGTIGDSVICSRTKGLYNAYIYYVRFNSGHEHESERKCAASGHDVNNKWNNVCKDVGATKSYIEVLMRLKVNGEAVNLWDF